LNWFVAITFKKFIFICKGSIKEKSSIIIANVTKECALKIAVGGIGIFNSSWCFMQAYTSMIISSDFSGIYLDYDTAFRFIIKFSFASNDDEFELVYVKTLRNKISDRIPESMNVFKLICLYGRSFN